MIETSAKVYNKVIPIMEKVVETCNLLQSNNSMSVQHKHFVAGEIKNECQDIVRELSHLTDVLDQIASSEESENPGYSAVETALHS